MSTDFLKMIHHPLKFKFFLLSKLPVAYFCGIRIVYADKEQVKVVLPYKWLTKNPFRSIYFACQAMAAEMSTGVLAMGNLYGQTPTSMLITDMSAQYRKKATGKITFTCEDGIMMENLIQEVIASGKPATFTAVSVGKNEEGEIVSEFKFTWSFKTKTTSKS